MNATQNIVDGCGYIFRFNGRAFSPEGGAGELTQADVDAHNAALAGMEREAMKQNGKGILYLHYTDGKPSHVGTWASKPGERLAVTYRTSRNNFGAKRTDVWFNFDGNVWHGVNVGDNDIVRVRRTRTEPWTVRN